MDKLEKFIIKAKANGWVGTEKRGEKIKSSREGAFDIIYNEGDYHYHDSFVGFSDFCGMEHITYKKEPVWSMAYYGYLLEPDMFSGDEAVDILKDALGEMYKQGRFLGGDVFKKGKFEYRDMNFGGYKKFNGVEKIYMDGKLVYELIYFGGLVKK
ncbi:MAG: hypothetical protein KAR54_00205 [Candidatus Pacebacteria bacterium]|nr:hypothetical protein [Candidatus Paceibacterota bacterium]